MSRFVIVVDTQADFIEAQGALPVPGAAALAEPMQRWLAALRPEDTAGVLFTFDSHTGETYPHSAEATQFPIHCIRGTPGWANVLDPGAIDAAIPVYRLEKDVFDMWAEPGVTVERTGAGEKTDRDTFFAALKAGGVTEVAVIGVAADFCVRWAIAGLLKRDFSVVVPRLLTRGIERPIEAVAEQDFAGAAVRLEMAA